LHCQSNCGNENEMENLELSNTHERSK
jgi:hypothetical protein